VRMRDGSDQDSYLNESATRVRNAVTFPFSTLMSIFVTSVTSAGGQYIVRTDKVTPLQGTPPLRAVVIAFDTVDKAKAWYTSPAQKEVNALADRSQKGRWFIAEGMSN
jgi:uncharacterized protein (DUF1330 family)